MEHKIIYFNFYSENSNTQLKVGGCKFFRMPFFAFLIVTLQCSCKKLVEISEPTSAITTTKVFSSDDIATNAMAGVYYSMVNSGEPDLLASGMTIFTGFSSDEINLYDRNNAKIIEFQNNNIDATNYVLSGRLWNAPFNILYKANAIIEGLENSRKITDSVKQLLLAEAKFVRAFINFNLINLYGDIPYVTNTNWRTNAQLSRMAKAEVYQNIVKDLLFSESTLSTTYRSGNSLRIIPNKFTVTAFLARVYLYLGDWQKAEACSSRVIGSSLYTLEANLDNVFKATSIESIWQLQQDNTGFSFNATNEGWMFVPIMVPGLQFPPYAYITSYLLNSFEPNDNRKLKWIGNTSINGSTYYFPYKYKLGRLEAKPNGNRDQIYTVFRLAEQYLIRAEARAHLNNLQNSIADINVIRLRAGIPIISNSLGQREILDAISHERQTELFAEWGHRWMDLKRTNMCSQVLAPIKGANWQPTDTLYPIPYFELISAPNLTQNGGY